MLSIMLKVEITPGTEIGRAAAEAKRLSDMLDVDIEFEFNGLALKATRKKTERQIVDEYIKHNTKQILPFSSETTDLINETLRHGERLRAELNKRLS